MWPRVNGLRALELGSPGALRAELNALVLAGAKTATAGLLDEYAQEDEALEHVGEHLVLLGNAGEPLAVIVVTGIEIRRFDEVTWPFADSEGEGYTDIQQWRDAHRRYWLEAEGCEVTDDTQIVCLSFRLLRSDAVSASAP